MTKRGVKCVVWCLDFGSQGYVRIEATSGVSEDETADIASDILAWVRSMRDKYHCPIVEQFEDGSQVRA